MNILFMIEVKILNLMKWLYRCLPPSNMLIIEPRMLINWARSIILLKHTSLCCPFFDPHVTTDHSNIVIRSNKLTMKSLQTLEYLTLGCEFYKRISFHKIGSSWSMWALVCVYWYRQPNRTLSWHRKSKTRMQMLCCGFGGTILEEERLRFPSFWTLVSASFGATTSLLLLMLMLSGGCGFGHATMELMRLKLPTFEVFVFASFWAVTSLLLLLLLLLFSGSGFEGPNKDVRMLILFLVEQLGPTWEQWADCCCLQMVALERWTKRWWAFGF